MEERCEWADPLNLVLIVLLAKPDLGLRTIGLFPMEVRVLMKARACNAKAREATIASKNLYGTTGLGAQRAACLEVFHAEASCLNKTERAQALMDLTKARELVSHDKLIQAARKRWYQLSLLPSAALSCCGRSVFQSHPWHFRNNGGICATTELRFLVVDVIEQTQQQWGKAVNLTVYGIDPTIFVRGTRK